MHTNIEAHLDTSTQIHTQLKQSDTKHPKCKNYTQKDTDTRRQVFLTNPQSQHCLSYLDPYLEHLLLKIKSNTKIHTYTQTEANKDVDI